MAKTALSVDGQFGLVDMTITAAHVAALPVLNPVRTPGKIVLSTVVARIEEGSPPSREVMEDFVVGDITPIVTPSSTMTGANFTIYFYYTKGKETLAPNSLDPITLLRQLHLLQPQLPVPFGWSIGGAIGDQREDTDANHTFITSIGSAVPGEKGKKLIPVGISTASVATSTIT